MTLGIFGNILINPDLSGVFFFLFLSNFFTYLISEASQMECSMSLNINDLTKPTL